MSIKNVFCLNSQNADLVFQTDSKVRKNKKKLSLTNIPYSQTDNDLLLEKQYKSHQYPIIQYKKKKFQHYNNVIYSDKTSNLTVVSQSRGSMPKVPTIRSSKKNSIIEVYQDPQVTNRSQTQQSIQQGGAPLATTISSSNNSSETNLKIPTKSRSKKKCHKNDPLEMKHLFDTYNQLSVNRVESNIQIKTQLDSFDNKNIQVDMMTQRTGNNNSCSNFAKIRKLGYREQYLQDLQEQINQAAKVLIKKRKQKKKKQSVAQSLIMEKTRSQQKIKCKPRQQTQMIVKLVNKFTERSPTSRAREAFINTSSRRLPTTTPLTTLDTNVKKFLTRSDRSSVQVIKTEPSLAPESFNLNIKKDTIKLLKPQQENTQSASSWKNDKFITKNNRYYSQISQSSLPQLENPKRLPQAIHQVQEPKKNDNFVTLMSKINGQWNEWDQNMSKMSSQINYLKLRQTQTNINNSMLNKAKPNASRTFYNAPTVVSSVHKKKVVQFNLPEID